LAQQVGLILPVEGNDQAFQAQSSLFYSILQHACDYSVQQLKTHFSKNRAVSYLKNRGLTGKIAKDYSIGFAPKGWDNLYKYLRSLGISSEDLVQAGLVIKKDSNRYYDRFRDRIMFPIKNRKGQVLGFGGRVINPEDSPKYLNSPESPVFSKGQILYGLYEARQKNRNLQECLVVEGYMDVVALAEYDIGNVVATLGTAVTLMHIQALFKSVKKIIFILFQITNFTKMG